MFSPNILHLYHPFYNAVKISGPLILIWHTYANIYVFIIICFCLPFMSSSPVAFSYCDHGSILDFCNFTNKIMYIKMIHSKFYMLQKIYLLPLLPQIHAWVDSTGRVLEMVSLVFHVSGAWWSLAAVGTREDEGPRKSEDLGRTTVRSMLLFLFNFPGASKDTSPFPPAEPSSMWSKVYSLTVCLDTLISFFDSCLCLIQKHLLGLPLGRFAWRYQSNTENFTDDWKILFSRIMSPSHAIRTNLFEKQWVSVFVWHLLKSQPFSYTIHGVDL